MTTSNFYDHPQMKTSIQRSANATISNSIHARHLIARRPVKASCGLSSTSQARYMSSRLPLRTPNHDSFLALRPGSLNGRIKSPFLNGASTVRSKHTSAPKSENGGGKPSEEPVSSRASRPLVVAVALSAVLVYLYIQYYPSEQAKIFDPPRFTTFTIIGREEVSPTSIVLTVRPGHQSVADSDPYKQSWESGTWSVEAKQPQLQIARSYTPLPPREGDRAEDLRFLIRKEHNGEVSGYLHTLPVGGIVQLRGPNLELGLSQPLTEVVFLAGGTGIAPALQLVHCLLERKDGGGSPFIRIVWANRRREDCIGGNSNVSSSVDRGYVVRELQALQLQHPRNLAVDYVVDEEGTRINQRKISQVIGSGIDAKGESSRLLVISGPEGFINHLAGPKRWEGGKEGQGDLGGLLGKMRLKGWQIWKL